jgi:CheY-like chemotaxis protein
VVTRRVLFVDEPLVLSGLRRSLGASYRIETAGSGAEALALIEESGADPFAVVVSDMMMPGMNGAELLRRVHLVDPDAVLLILSGQADLTSTVAAVNNAGLFRFLTKPSSAEDLRRALDDALRHHQLVLAERELLERTLSGAVDTLMKLLALASPTAFGRADRVSGLVGLTAARLGTGGWELRIGALLSQIGCVAVPEQIVESVRYGGTLTDEEQAIYVTHPQVARDLLAGIPRLERVADWVATQPVPGSALPEVGSSADSRSEGEVDRAILHGAIAFLAAQDLGPAGYEAVRTFGEHYPREVVAALRASSVELASAGAAAEVTVAELRPGMVLDQDVVTSTEMMLVRSGERIDHLLITRLQNFARSVGVVEPIRVIVPADAQGH